MARQTGIIKIKGKLDDLSFYKTKDGDLVRRKGGVDGDTIANSPNFQRTRENNSEFGRAASGGKLVRVAFNAILQSINNSRLVSELTQKMMEVVKADSNSVRGQRNVIDGEIDLLLGFNFNSRVKLSNVLYFAIQSALDRATGKLTYQLPAFNPQIDVIPPAGATHLRLTMAASALGFATETFNTDIQSVAPIPLTGGPVAAQNVETDIPVATTLPVVGIVLVEFLQQVNTVLYPLKNGSYNAMQVVVADF